jgi:hypothetical protein
MNVPFTFSNKQPLHPAKAKDWPPFKEAIQVRADIHDTTWLFEGGRTLALFFDKTNRT